MDIFAEKLREFCARNKEIFTDTEIEKIVDIAIFCCEKTNSYPDMIDKQTHMPEEGGIELQWTLRDELDFDVCFWKDEGYVSITAPKKVGTEEYFIFWRDFMGDFESDVSSPIKKSLQQYFEKN